MISNVLPLCLKQTFPPIIWICTEGVGIESKLPFKIFSTLKTIVAEILSFRMFTGFVKQKLLVFLFYYVIPKFSKAIEKMTCQFWQFTDTQSIAF